MAFRSPARWSALLAPLGLVAFAAAFGCGQSESGRGNAGNAGQSATAGHSTSGAAAGGAGAAAGGTSSASGSGGASAGSSTAGKPAGGAGAAAGGAGGAVSGAAGAAGATGGSNAGLVDCDPKKVLCKRSAPECVAGEVPSVVDSCYGDCVKVDTCACTSAEQCPLPEQYTCWAKRHCGPFVR